MPKVSIIVPCYKVEKYLNRCVESLVNQTLQDIEIILVDDGSPDNVPQMCENWARKDTRIRVVHKDNAGLGMACNTGIDASNGDYIAFCDSDDYVDIECYETLYQSAISTGVDAVFSGIKRVDQNGVVSPMCQATKDHLFIEDEIEKFQLDMIASPPSDKVERHRQMSAKLVLYSSKIIHENNVRFHSERQYISEDLLFNLDFLRYSHSILELTRSFYYYFVNTSSLSLVFRHDRFVKYKILREYLLSHYTYIKSQVDFKRRVNKMFIGYTRSALQRIVHSNLPYKNKISLLTDICNDVVWDQLAYEYPINKMPINKRIVFELICHHWVVVLYILLKLKFK